MIEELKKELENLKSNPPWRQGETKIRNIVVESIGAPQPREYSLWKNNLRRLKARISRLAEEEARQQINRP